MRPVILVFVLLSLFLGCTENYSKLPRVSVDFTWPAKSNIRKSPAIELKNVPDSTHSLQINMFDLDNRINHDGGNIVNDGKNLIPQGALKKYRGPTPIYGSPRYEISVKALDVNGKVIGFGKKIKKYPPETK